MKAIKPEAFHRMSRNSEQLEKYLLDVDQYNLQTGQESALTFLIPVSISVMPGRDD